MTWLCDGMSLAVLRTVDLCTRVAAGAWYARVATRASRRASWRGALYSTISSGCVQRVNTEPMRTRSRRETLVHSVTRASFSAAAVCAPQLKYSSVLTSSESPLALWLLISRFQMCMHILHTHVHFLCVCTWHVIWISLFWRSGARNFPSIHLLPSMIKLCEEYVHTLVQ